MSTTTSSSSAAAAAANNSTSSATSRNITTDSMTQQQSLPTTVTGALRLAQKTYNEIQDLSPIQEKERHQQKVTQCVALYLRLWAHISNEGIFRKGESLKEMTDTSLELITVPFFLGVLCEKKQINTNTNTNNTNANANANNNNNSDDSRVSATSAASSSSMNTSTGIKNEEIAQRVARSNTRLHSLVACNDFLFKFLKVAVEVGLATEKEVETKPFLSSLDRTSRLEISKKRFAFEDEFKQLDTKVRFARERAKRDAKIMKQDDAIEYKKLQIQKKEENENENNYEQEESEIEAEKISEEYIENLLEDNDDYQTDKRDRHIALAQWCIFESYSLLQGNAREMEILGSLSDDEKMKAIEDFQRALVSDSRNLSSTSASSAMFNNAQTLFNNKNGNENENLKNGNYTVLPGGQVVPFGSATAPAADFRQQVREEAFMNRNLPTQTLDEFAEMEMAYMKEMQDKEQQGKADQQAEEERLGEDGVEEKERQRQTAWDDWRDDNPAVGITSKGNYS